MTTLDQLCNFLQSHAPTELAEEWDNVGLLVGRREARVERVMTCLTVTPKSAAEAVSQRADLVVSHHPLPFQPLRRITDDTTPGRLLLELIAAGVALYSPHTGFDSARLGINQHLAEGLGLESIEPLATPEQAPLGLGSGRRGELPAAATLAEVAERLKSFLAIDLLRAVGDPQQPLRRVAVACGSGGSLLGEACRANCELLVTGEANFHTCLEAEASGIGLLLAGHYASERFGIELLAEAISAEFSDATVWASRDEADPLVAL
jgi:dinuclear metal center YbgI/SA1388 family protein